MQKSMNGQGIYTPGKPRRVNDGWNLSDVLRDIVFHLMEDRSWSYGEMARQLDEAESTMHRFLFGVADGSAERDQDAKVRLLSKLCSRLGETPAELFARHPVFAPEGDLQRQLVHERVTSALIAPEARALLPLLEQARDLGVLDLCLSQLHLTIESRKRSEQAVRRARRKPGG